MKREPSASRRERAAGTKLFPESLRGGRVSNIAELGAAHRLWPDSLGGGLRSLEVPPSLSGTLVAYEQGGVKMQGDIVSGRRSEGDIEVTAKLDV